MFTETTTRRGALAVPVTLVVPVALAFVLAGCTTAEPTLGERLTADATARSALAERAVEGERLVERGEALVERGQRRVRRGEGEVSEGRALIERGERILRDTRRSVDASSAGT